jgi:hypothetical protein
VIYCRHPSMVRMNNCIDITSVTCTKGRPTNLGSNPVVGQSGLPGPCGGCRRCLMISAFGRRRGQPGLRRSGRWCIFQPSILPSQIFGPHSNEPAAINLAWSVCVASALAFRFYDRPTATYTSIKILLLSFRCFCARLLCVLLRRTLFVHETLV